MSPEPENATELAPETSDKSAPAAVGGGFWKGFAGGLLGGIIVSVATVGGIVALGPVVKSFALNDELIRIATIEQDLRMLADKVETAETATPRTPDLSALTSRLREMEGRSGGADPAVTSLTRRLDDLQAENARLKADLDNVRKSLPGEGVLLNLAERAEQAEKAVRAVAQRRQSAEATLLAVGQMKSAIDRGDPYQSELRSARRFSSAESAPAFETLAIRATAGVPTRSGVIESFPTTAESVLQAGDTGTGIWDRIKRQAAKLISVRRVDTEGTGRDALLARAEQALKTGDLGKAVEQLAALRGAEAEAAAPWIESAKARIVTDQAVSAIVAAVAAESAETNQTR